MYFRIRHQTQAYALFCARLRGFWWFCRVL